MATMNLDQDTDCKMYEFYQQAFIGAALGDSATVMDAFSEALTIAKEAAGAEQAARTQVFRTAVALGVQHAHDLPGGGPLDPYHSLTVPRMRPRSVVRSAVGTLLDVEFNTADNWAGNALAEAIRRGDSGVKATPIAAPIECAVCQKRVDAIEVCRDVLKREVVVVIACHGTTQEERISYREATDESGQIATDLIAGCLLRKIGAAFKAPVAPHLDAEKADTTATA